MRSRKKKKRCCLTVWSHTLFKLYTWASIHPAPRWEQLIKVARVLWKKGPEPNSYYLSLRLVWISLQKRKKKLFVTPHKHNSSTRPVVHALSAPGSLASLTRIGCHGNCFHGNNWKAGWWWWHSRRSWQTVQGWRMSWTCRPLTSQFWDYINMLIQWHCCVFV